LRTGIYKAIYKNNAVQILNTKALKSFNKSIMQKTLTFMLLFCAVITVLRAQSPVITSEDQRFQAMISRDTVLLQKLIHKDLIYVHSNTLEESKTDFIHSVATGKIQYHAMRRDKDKIVVTQWRKTAIVNGEVAVKGINNSTPFDIKLRYLSVYRKKSGKWVLYRWQSTRVPS
jgi:Domain of unknown function (DUF4440)